MDASGHSDGSGEHTGGDGEEEEEERETEVGECLWRTLWLFASC